MESESPMTHTLSPSQALDDALAARAHVAARAECPAYMHVLTALLLSTMVAIQALPVIPNLIALAGCLCAIAAIVVWRRRRYGFFVNGYRRGRTLRVALALLALVEIALFGGIWLK